MKINKKLAIGAVTLALNTAGANASNLPETKKNTIQELD